MANHLMNNSVDKNDAAAYGHSRAVADDWLHIGTLSRKSPLMWLSYHNDHKLLARFDLSIQLLNSQRKGSQNLVLYLED